jgi:hypothetical protein
VCVSENVNFYQLAETVSTRAWPRLAPMAATSSCWLLSQTQGSRFSVCIGDSSSSEFIPQGLCDVDHDVDQDVDHKDERIADSNPGGNISQTDSADVVRALLAASSERLLERQGVEDCRNQCRGSPSTSVSTDVSVSTDARVGEEAFEPAGISSILPFSVGSSRPGTMRESGLFVRRLASGIGPGRFRSNRGCAERRPCGVRDW